MALLGVLVLWPVILLSLPAIGATGAAAKRARRNLVIGVILFIIAVVLAGVFGDEF